MILTGGIRIKRNEILRKLVGLSSSAKLLFWYLLTIVDFAGEAQGKFRGYINDLVALTEIKYDTAYRAIKELEERCLLKFSAGRNQYDKSEIEIIGYGNFLEADKKQIKSKSRADKEHGLEMALRREDASSKNLKNIKNMKDSSKEESPGGIVKGGNLRTSASRNFREAEQGKATIYTLLDPTGGKTTLVRSTGGKTTPTGGKTTLHQCGNSTALVEKPHSNELRERTNLTNLDNDESEKNSLSGKREEDLPEKEWLRKRNGGEIVKGGEDLPEEVWMKRQLEKTAANWEL